MRKTLLFALLVFLVSLAIRLAWVGFAHVTPVSDFQVYDQLARRWLETGAFSPGPLRAYSGPGYPAFLALIYAVSGPDHVVATVVQAVLAALTSGMLVLLASFVLSPRASALAGLLHSVWPTALAYVAVLASENLAAPLVVAGCLTVSAARTLAGWRRDVVCAGAGVLGGLLLLVRPAGLFLMPALVVLAAHGRQGRRWRVVSAVAFVLGVGAVLAPWVVRNQAIGLGFTPLPTNGGHNLWLGNNPDAVHGGYCPAAQVFPRVGEKEDDARYRAAALAWIVSHPGRYAALCGTRALRLLGTVPDHWATDYYRPTAEHDELCRAVLGRSDAAKPPVPQAAHRLAELEGANQAFEERVRTVVVPLMLLAAGLALRRLRDFSVILIPAGTYLAGLALTFAQPRFRQLSDPLLLIPLAALLADLLFGTQELGRWPRQRWKWIIAASAVAGSVFVYARGISSDWYELHPPSLPSPETPGYTFVPVQLEGPAEEYRSTLWTVRVNEVRVSRNPDGIRCEVIGHPANRGQYGGIRFPAPDARAVRLEMQFVQPDNIKAVYVDGYTAAAQRVMRWKRVAAANKPLPEGVDTIVLTPDTMSPRFQRMEDTPIQGVRECHVFVEIKPNTTTGFVLRRAEVAD